MLTDAAAPDASAAARWLETECYDLVAEFWANAGSEEPFPRTLANALCYAYPVALLPLAGLSTGGVRNWLRARGRDLVIIEASRPLHGCMVASRGNALIFMDANDSPAEQRFTIAHEIAHYLVDYMLPRRRALARLGAEFADVLDGRRPASMGERLSVILLGLAPEPHVNLLQRSIAGEDALAVWAVEARSDRLGLALLAPPHLVLAAALGDSLAARRAAATQALVDLFGLPPGPAQRYAAALLPESANGAWLESLRARVQHAAGALRPLP